MNIFLGADHGGFVAKELLKTWLITQSYQVEDCGALTLDPSDDYPDFALAVAQKVAAEPETGRGILVCRSGAGVVIAANKVRGVRAAVAVNEAMVEHARKDNDIRVLGIGADQLTADDIQKIVQKFLTTEFSPDERHHRRVEKIMKYEQGPR